MGMEIKMNQLNLKYLPTNIKTVIIVNDFDYIEGGASKVALMTAEALVKSDYDTYLFSAVSSKDKAKICGIKYVTTNQYASLSDSNKIRGAINGLYNFKAAKEFKNLLKQLNSTTTLIHIHTWTKALSCSIWNVAYSMHFPIYLTCHDYFSVCPNGGFYDYQKNCICHKKPLSATCLKCNCDSRNYAIKLYRFARTFIQNKVINIFKKTTKFISISDFSENILKTNFPNNIKFERIYNPIDGIKNIEKIHLEWAAKAAERKLSIVRPGIVFGTGEKGNMTRLFKGLKSHMFAYAGRKDTIKACIYVKDLAHVMLAMAENKDAEKIQLYNCCYYPSFTIEQITNTILKVTGMKRFIPFIPKKPMMTVATVCGLFGGLGLNICPARVKKLMISTNNSGEKLNRNYPLTYTLEGAFEDWWNDCEQKVLE